MSAKRGMVFKNTVNIGRRPLMEQNAECNAMFCIVTWYSTNCGLWSGDFQEKSGGSDAEFVKHFRKTRAFSEYTLFRGRRNREINTCTRLTCGA